MPEYLSPGVYMEEVDKGPKPIEGVGTAMAAFVGFTEKAELEREIDGVKQIELLANRPHLVTNWSQYVEAFGSFVPGAYLPHAVYGYFNNGGTRCYVVSIKSLEGHKAEQKLLGTGANPPTVLIATARQAGDAGMLQVVIEPEGVVAPPPEAPPAEGAQNPPAPPAAGANPPPPPPPPPAPTAFTVTVKRRLDANSDWSVKEKLSGVKFVPDPNPPAGARAGLKVAYASRPSQWIDLEVPAGITANKLVQALATAQTLEIQLAASAWAAPDTAIMGTEKDANGNKLAESERPGLMGLAPRDGITMLCVPDLPTLARQKGDRNKQFEFIKSVHTAMIDHCERMGDRVAILDAPPDLSPEEALNWRMNYANYDSSYAAFYYPWIKVHDPILNQPVAVPPSGHVAGIWARSDNTRGVHKAPANEKVNGAVGLVTQVSKGEQDMLNPKGVNCIRTFPGMGIRVWGARTVSSNPAWRYINVRRLFNYVEKSIEGGTQWVVFEPNDPFLWARVTRDVTAFLSGVWSSGALFGATPAEAFYVKCDEELNPASSRDEGKLIIEIGMSPVKPAEFVIFRISQWTATS